MRISLYSLTLISFLACTPVFGMEQATKMPSTGKSWLESLLSIADKIVNPFVDPASQFVGKVIETAADANLNKYAQEKTQEHLKKEAGQFKEFIDDLSSGIKTLSKDYALQLTPEQWLKYSQEINKQNAINHPLGLADIKKLIEESRTRLIESAKNKTFDEFDKQQARTYLEAIKKLHQVDVQTLETSWNSKQNRYFELQHKLNLSGGWFKTALRYLGYGAVFVGGPYVGNAIYRRYLASFFSNTHQEDKTALLNHIKKIHEQCEKRYTELATAQAEEGNTNTTAERKQALQELITNISASIKQMETEINQLTLKMSASQSQSSWRKYAGIAARIGTMAAVTYIFYAIFKKIDERYLTTALTDLPLTPEQRAILLQEFNPLQFEKETLDKQILMAKQIDAGLISVQNAGDDASLIHRILGLRRALEQLPAYERSLKDMARQADEVGLESISHLLSMSGFGG